MRLQCNYFLLLKMELSLIQIGNSRGIRLPKSWIKQLGFEDKLEVDIQDEVMTIRPAKKKLRQGWAESAKKMSQISTNSEQKEWQNFSNEFDKTEPVWGEK